MNFEKLTQFLDEIPRYSAPGVDCIVKVGYETVYRHQAGWSDREARIPMNGSEQVWLYSMTKPITVATVMRLVQDGALALDDLLSKFYPEFAGTPITIEHLLSMSAGFDYDLTTPAIRELQQKTDGRFPTPCIAQALAQQPLHFVPGSKWQYSLCHDVLGAVMEKVTGKTFGTVMHELILDPLGMVHSTFRPNRDALAAQYAADAMTGSITRISSDNVFVLGSEYESGGAGLASTLEDYSLFAAAMSNGGVGENGAQILKPETIDELRRSRLSNVGGAVYGLDSPHMACYDYALGVRTMVRPEANGSRVDVGEFGWDGAAGSYVSLNPARGVSIVYLQHMLMPHSPYVQPRLRELVYEGLDAE